MCAIPMCVMSDFQYTLTNKSQKHRIARAQ